MKRMLIRGLIVSALMGGSAFGGMTYQASRVLPDSVKQNSYVRCATYVQQVRRNPTRLASPRAQRRHARCVRVVRRFERRFGTQAAHLVRATR